MTIEDFLRLLLRNLLLLVAGLVLGAAAGYGLSFTQSTTYSASALGYVSASAQSDENGDPIVYRVESVQEGGVRDADGDQSVYSLYERAYAMHLDARGEDINGGFPEDAMQTITGQNADAYDSLKLEELAEQLDRGNLVNADTGGIDDPSHDQIVGNHAYTVTSVDPEAGTVTVTNPWGPGNPDAPKNVTMTYEEYQETFGRTTVGRTEEQGVFERIGFGDGIGWF